MGPITKQGGIPTLHAGESVIKKKKKVKARARLTLGKRWRVLMINFSAQAYSSTLRFARAKDRTRCAPKVRLRGGRLKGRNVRWSVDEGGRGAVKVKGARTRPSMDFSDEIRKSIW